MNGERKYDGQHAGAGDLGNVIDTTKSDVIGSCPSCGAELSVNRVDHKGKRRDVLLHAMPFCHYFGATDPDRIVQDVTLAKLIQ